jgi:purine nucleosidase
MASDALLSRAVVIDTDPGIDDALAILLALQSPELEVLGISTVHGNVPLSTTTRNAFRILHLAGRLDIPVYRGAERPLSREPYDAAEVHGSDGLGGVDLADPGDAPRGDAVSFLIQTLRDRAGEVDLVCLGPLTNLALAEQAAPGILSRARRVLAMGGAVDEPGNVTPTAEFNFFADPDAARAVILSGSPLALVPLDVTHRVTLDDVHLEGAADTAQGRFVVQSVSACMDRAERILGIRQFHLHDPLAVGAAIDPAVCTYERVWLDVETRGALTAGQVVADRRPVAEEAQRRGLPCDCAMRVDAERFLSVIKQRLLR